MPKFTQLKGSESRANQPDLHPRLCITSQCAGDENTDFGYRHPTKGGMFVGKHFGKGMCRKCRRDESSTLQRLSCVVKAKLALQLRVWGRMALPGSWMPIWSET